MDPLAPPPAATPADPRDLIDDLLAGRADRTDIDVRTFLLDPPPTAEEAARLERRRQLVRRSSLAAAGIIAVVLVAPWPGSRGTDDVGASAAASPASLEETSLPELVPATPPRAVRLDAAPAPSPRGGTARARAARARTARARTARAGAHPQRAAAPARSAQVAAPSIPPPPTPRPAQRPATPTTPPSTGAAGDAIRAPVL